MENKAYYCDTLQKLYTGHPARHLLCKDVYTNESGQVKKKVITVHQGAQLEDYLRHLSIGSIEGVNALGINPTYPEQRGEQSRWMVKFLALDFDALKLPDVMQLIAVLEEHRVYVYADTGTTGRGIHLYIFLYAPLPQWEAHKVLTTIANLSKSLGLPYPEFMPSSASGPSRGIFLPYRGAEEDGLGANPLIDPNSGAFIPLGEAEEEIAKTEAIDLQIFIEDLNGDGAYHSTFQDTVDATSRDAIGTGTYADAVKAWQAEVKRLDRFWIEGRRQHLALGVAAYGLTIGITADTIRKDIKCLETKSDSPEVKERLKAVDGTVEKHDRGDRVAYRKWYRLADVEPPVGGRVVPYEVFLKLKILEEKLRCANFKGVGGLTDFDVLTELLEVGRRYGESHPWGVKVSISVRDLALRARAGATTISASLKRLEEREPRWVKRLDRGVGTNSGSVVLSISKEDVDSYELPEEDTEAEGQGKTNFHIPYFRWGTGELGKMIRPILQHLQVLQPCLRADIARAMGRNSRDIKEHMKRLRKYGLVEYDETTHLYTLPTDFESRLSQALFANGIHQTDLRHKNLFERERMAFRALRAIKAKKEKVGT